MDDQKRHITNRKCRDSEGKGNSIVLEVLASLNKAKPSLACFDCRCWGHDFEISVLNSSSWISIEDGPYPTLTHPVTPEVSADVLIGLGAIPKLLVLRERKVKQILVADIIDPLCYPKDKAWTYLTMWMRMSKDNFIVELSDCAVMTVLKRKVS
ncbi:hypothetical protein J6590_038594 [Homalodisca vitripennis]|nr:hypothetical protein J6590_038594 [Homalodisca vitripennis]